jgi:hypothetical protein
MSERKLLGYRVRWEGKYCTPPNFVFVEDKPFPVSRGVAEEMAKPLTGSVLVRVYAKPIPEAKTKSLGRVFMAAHVQACEGLGLQVDPWSWLSEAQRSATNAGALAVAEEVRRRFEEKAPLLDIGTRWLTWRRLFAEFQYEAGK